MKNYVKRPSTRKQKSNIYIYRLTRRLNVQKYNKNAVLKLYFIF